MTKIADDCLAIKARMEEIAAERAANIMGKPLEDAQPTEAPADIDWGMYAPCGFQGSVGYTELYTALGRQWAPFDIKGGGTSHLANFKLRT